ncbi:uncharacterized protein TNCV_3320711 [Trichonephila clavipes]|nr:uncharacterized protein TNCV_3320711 [Trichonephila clavipes]
MLTGILYFNESLAISASQAMKKRTLAKHGCYLPQPSVSLSCRQSVSNISRSAGKYICRIQENDARGKVWETLLHSPVPMGLPRKVFSAVFRALTSHDFLWQHLYRIGVKDTPDCPLCLCGEAMNFVHLTLCPSLANTSFNFSSDNFTVKAGLYWAAHREMAYTAIP